ncbi:MAG: glycosyltransferase family 4 protein [Chloroflexi bacterium]|nr:glycosyltransferase family 4 protein [Chloroflexota bacterium]
MSSPRRVALHSPLPPVASGIADHTAELLPHLARHVGVDVFVAGCDPVDVAITSPVRLRPIAEWRDPAVRAEYDLAIFHLGNHRLHEPIFEALRLAPGVAVIHDAVLHHYYADVTLGRRDGVGYLRELGYAYGDDGVRFARAVVAGECEVPWYEYPMLRRPLEQALATVVHSEHARRVALAESPAAQIWHIPLAVAAEPVAEDRAALRQQLGLPTDAFVVACLGHITPAKRIGAVLRAFESFVRAHHDRMPTVLALVGEPPEWYNLREALDQMGCRDWVRVTGRASRPDFQRWAVAADVVVNLRYPTAGETSSSVVRALLAGTAVVVSDVGWFRELPDTVVAKVPVDASETDALARQLERLAGDREWRRNLGRRAAIYAHQVYDPAHAAECYAELIGAVLADLTRFGAPR